MSLHENESMNHLQVQRGRLLERIRQQRAELACAAYPIKSNLAKFDKLHAYFAARVDDIKKHPRLLILLLGVLLLTRPKGLLLWFKRGVFAWQTWRAWRSFRANLFAFIERF